MIAPAFVAAQTPTPTPEQIEIYKSLPKEQQDAVLQSTLGRGGSTASRDDRQSGSPDTVQPGKDARSEGITSPTDAMGRPLREKTRDGRKLRIKGENPELRPGDSVLIEMISKVEYAKQQRREADLKASESQVRTDTMRPIQRKVPEDTRTDEQKKKSEELQKRILKYNPYKLNRFGVLEIPGLEAIPVAGLTADEATERLSAVPEMSDFYVRLSLLRLESFGDAALKPFGYDLFEGVPSTFAPVNDIAVPADYAVGPGDTIEVQLFGSETGRHKLEVTRDGTIQFPKIGPILVGGLTFERARTLIEQRVKQRLLGTQASVSIGDLRSIRVFVLGEAERPGSYAVSGLSTMTNALFVSGGVKKIGSLRSIQLKRSGRLVTTLDLYDLLLRGDTSSDRKLLPGDVIFIPPIGSVVSVDGEVRRPAIYEIKSEKTVADVIDVAGGLNPEADATRGSLERISDERRVTLALNLTSGGRETVQNGDKLHIAAIRPTLENSVTLTGHVFRSGSFEWREGMRLSDVIGSIDELRPNADRHYVMVRRQSAPDRKVQVVSADLDRALGNRGSSSDIPLQPRDQVIVFDLSNDRERVIGPILDQIEVQASAEEPAQVVNVSGRVKSPGRYPLEPQMRVSDLIRAGGSMEDSAFGGEAELTRYQVVNGEKRQTDLVKIDLAAVLKGEVSANLSLRPYDTLVIKEIPAWEEEASIEVIGEVRFPGKYPILRGETLRSALSRAGGVTDLAFQKGAVFTRKVLKQREKEQIDLLSNRFQSDLTSLSLQSLANTTSSGGNNSAGVAVAVGQELIEELRNTKPVGRLVIDLHHVTGSGRDGDIVLQDGDKLIVPKLTQEVTLIGEVQSPTSHVLRPGLSRDDYIAESGGLTQKADKKRIYVVRADGSVMSNERRGWFRRGDSGQIEPGDTIVVPLDAERIRALPLWTAVTTIIYNLAVATAAVARF